MAETALTFLLENVPRLVKTYVDLIEGAESELEELTKDLGKLKAFLQAAAKKQKKAETFKEIESQIRELVYDVEDTIDLCLTEEAAARESWTKRYNPKRIQKKSSMAEKVKSLREEKVKPVLSKDNMDFANMKISDGSGSSVEEQWTTEKRAPVIRQDNVVGFEDQEQIFINYLNEEKEELDVISIIGMPGLGKTTLAWRIFQNREIEFQFPTRIWVYVSQEFNEKDVFLSIVKAFTNEDMSSLSEHDLAQKVRHFLKEGKFLLVMDDVWTVAAWNVIQHVLPKSNKLGKVLITSRDTKVAMHANVTREPHTLRFLSEEESWELLELEVFGKSNRCPQELKDKGKTIAKECGGLPLAIVVIGGILVEQRSIPVNNATINAWNKISENVSMYFREYDKEHSISKIVALSYNNLPNDLRDCFLYLAVFPEDYEIPAWTLTRLWMAEGFIRHKQEQSLEEVAEENLKDLINRNLAMVVKTNPDGQVKTCRVHDVIHVFCNSKAAEQNLFRGIKMSKQGVFNPQLSDIQKYRRLCIHSHLSKFLCDKFKGPRIRSFLCFNKEKYRLEAKRNTTITDAFTLLRVLDSKSIIFTEFPTKVKKLIHLRYITLRCDNLAALPKEISGLRNLLTLVVETSSNSLKIFANIWGMTQLRHLKTKAAIVLAIQERGEAGENLQTLSRLSPEHCTKDVFDMASNLKRLGIRGQLATHLNARPLKKLDRLENLKLVNDLVYGLESRLNGLPQPNCFPRNLRRLTLSATFLDWKHMPILGKINTLQVLKLKDNAFTGDSWKVDDGGFGSLQFLLIASTDLEYWEASTDDFPSLKCLVLKNCKKLSRIPLCLEKSLQILNLELVAESVIKFGRKIEVEKLGFKLSIGPARVTS